MADEISFHLEMKVKKGNLDWRSNPNRFNVDMDSDAPAFVGGLLIPTTGKEIDLSALASIGVCWLHNIDETNFVTAGVYDVTADRFQPYQEIGPGEFYPLKLSRYFKQEFVGTGTGTNSDQNKWMFIADSASCYVEVYIFER